MDNFPDCLAFVWLPQNDGAPNNGAEGEDFITQWGVTADDWQVAVSRGVVTGTIRTATKDQCAAVLRALHWDACNCGKMASGCDLMVFNDAMVCGSGHCTDLVQRIVDTTSSGFGIGPITLLAIRGMGAKAFIQKMHDADEAYYAALAKAPLFLRGWDRREDDAMAAAYKMAGING